MVSANPATSSSGGSNPSSPRRHSASTVLGTFTFNRNTFRSSGERSADFLARHIELVLRGAHLSKIESNVVGGLATSLGIFSRSDGTYKPTRLAEAFLGLYRQDKIDAWRWLATRALWRFVVPNGTASSVNSEAKTKGITISFFRTLVGALTLLDRHTGEARYLYYQELCEILGNDANWALDGEGMYRAVLKLRGGKLPPLSTRRGLLAELEEEYAIGRDNWNGLLGKLFQQTGLFGYIKNGPKTVGIALSSELAEIEEGRVRFILDHPVVWDEKVESWEEFLELHTPDLPEKVYRPRTAPIATEPTSTIQGIVPAAAAAFKNAGLLIEIDFVRRFTASLLAKRFVILTGLSGSGKTKLAQAFAAWLTPGSTNLEVSGPFGSGYELVPVGADWTSSENILGYADALDHSRYVRTQALDILLRARERPRLPHFLILDEMNLSHVERYFSDFLSAIEANESLRLYSDTSAERDGVPSSIVLPPNLFVVGTVNVDETTYMFSPKVLDRANVIEFRVGSEQMMGFLEDPKGIQLEQLAGQGVRFAEAFVDASQHPAKLEAVDRQKLRDVSMLFFDVLEQHGAEFGFRIANEMSRFISSHRRLSTEAWSFEEAMDAQVVQKLLPKLHGSRRRLEPLLCGLAALCYYPHEWKAENATVTLSSVDELRTKAAQFASLAEPNLHPLARNDLGAYLLPKDQAHFSLAYDKLVRMLRALEENGFTSFAEA